MTVSSESSIKTYAGNGVTTSFDTSPVVFFSSDDITVYITNNDTDASVALVENTDYELVAGWEPGSAATIDMTLGGDPYGAPATGTTVVIVRALELVQEFDPDNGDSSDADALEQQFDKLTMMVQQLEARVARTVALPVTSVQGGTLTVERVINNGLIGFDNNGDITVIENPDTARMSVRDVTASTYTLVATDDQQIVRMVNGGTVTVPADMQDGHITGILSGSGTVAVVAGSGATLAVAASYSAELAETHSFAAVVMRGSNAWQLFGDLTLA